MVILYCNVTEEHLSTLQGSECTERGNLSMHKSVDRRSILKKNNIQANLEARRCIKSALLALLKKKSYDDIRMTDIINKSGVSRTCVYNNYKSKDEIMQDLYSKTIETVLSTPTGSLDSNLAWLFNIAYQHKAYIRTLIDAGLANTFLDSLNERSEDTSESFYSAIINGLCYNAVIEWVKSDTDESPQSAVKRVKEALSRLAKSIETN